MFKNISLIILCSFLFTNIVAQDTQYWAKQYGTYGELLGGTVVGGISDLSSTYYNPGSMAFTKDSTLILTTHSLQAYLITLNNAFGSDETLSSSSVKTSQGIFAIRLPFKWLGDNQIVISYISRYDFNFEAQDIVVSPYSKNQNSFKANEVMVYQNLAEYWPGISWSRQLNKNVGFGATVYFPYRSQRARNQIISQEIDSTKTNSSVIVFENYSYFNLRMLVKFGASVKLNPLMLGITITTPSINLFGRGSSGMNLSMANVDFSNTQDFPTFASNYQEDLSAQYHSPLSIAIGTAYYLDNTSFYFTAEWFNNVDEFKIMNSKSFQAQSSGEEVYYNSYYSLSSVINFGFGIKHIVNSNYIFYGSITSDQTAYVPNSLNKFAISNWDIVHIRTGGMFDIENISLTLGLGYGFSGNIYNALKIFGQETSDRNNIEYHQLDIVFGFTYNL